MLSHDDPSFVDKLEILSKLFKQQNENLRLKVALLETENMIYRTQISPQFATSEEYDAHFHDAFQREYDARVCEYASNCGLESLLSPPRHEDITEDRAEGHEHHRPVSRSHDSLGRVSSFRKSAHIRSDAVQLSLANSVEGLKLDSVRSHSSSSSPLMYSPLHERFPRSCESLSQFTFARRGRLSSDRVRVSFLCGDFKEECLDASFAFLHISPELRTSALIHLGDSLRTIPSTMQDIFRNTIDSCSLTELHTGAIIHIPGLDCACSNLFLVVDRFSTVSRTLDEVVDAVDAIFEVCVARKFRKVGFLDLTRGLFGFREHSWLEGSKELLQRFTSKVILNEENSLLVFEDLCFIEPNYSSETQILLAIFANQMEKLVQKYQFSDVSDMSASNGSLSDEFLIPTDASHSEDDTSVGFDDMESDPSRYYAVPVHVLDSSRIPDSPEFIEFDDSTVPRGIRSATIEKLIERVTTHVSEEFSHKFLNTFLLTFESFIDPKSLLRALIDRFNLAPDPEMSFEEFRHRVLDTVRLRVCLVLTQLLKRYDGDLDREFLENCFVFLETHVSYVYGVESPVVRKLRHAIEEAEKRSASGFEGRDSSIDLLSSLHPDSMSDDEIDILSIDLKEFARQITLFEFRIFQRIGVREFFHQNWLSPNKITKSPHIVALVSHFNWMCRWIASKIISTEDLKKRKSVLKRFILLGVNFMELKNVNAIYEVVAGLCSSGVHRLKKTWEQLSVKTREDFQRLQSLSDPQGGAIAMREFLRGIEPPCLPYLGRFLTDLVFIEDGNVTIIQNKINFHKLGMISKVITELQQFQQTPYLFAENPRIQGILRTLPALSEDELWERSLKIEPRA